MTLDEYQERAMTTDVFNGTMQGMLDPAFLAKLLGLVGESGEVAEKCKKIIRDKGGVLSIDDREELLKELGDVLWYVAVLSRYLGESFEDVAERNIDKLASRKARGVTQGSGDNR